MDRLLFFPKQQFLYNDASKLMSEFNIDIIHAHTLFSNGWMAYRLKRKYDIPYIVAVRSTDVYTFFRRMPHLRKLGLRVLCSADIVVFLSSTLRNVLENKYIPDEYRALVSSKSIVIPNGIDPLFIENKWESHKKISDTVNVIFIGRIDKRKNLPVLVKACDIINNQGRKVHLKVIGNIFDSKIAEFALSHQYVEYIPFSSPQKIIGHLRSSDVLVVPSLRETFGLVYAEAMSQGVPVIYSCGEGFDGQFADGEVGYAVDPHSPDDIAEKINKVICNHGRLSENCISLVDKFDWRNISSRYFSVYDSIVNRQEWIR
ncbi:MAG: glycosyltransferase family 4 protein [bacterium]|uniref:Glycosyltransferase family 4 protein n=1 Tax=Candidatus Aphodosoma intestinipullorum TaxID=2840674 RepID=A0A940DMF0_9BACT|nr:glycosyltransferase family 4 protein [Candidatus Aphodosoma intestinipullorum]